MPIINKIEITKLNPKYSNKLTIDPDTKQLKGFIGNLVVVIGGGSSSSTITDVKVNGSSVVTNKVANITVPTKTSLILNDSNFLTLHQDISGKLNISTLETDVKSFINAEYIASLIADGTNISY